MPARCLLIEDSASTRIIWLEQSLPTRHTLRTGAAYLHRSVLDNNSSEVTDRGNGDSSRGDGVGSGDVTRDGDGFPSPQAGLYTDSPVPSLEEATREGRGVTVSCGTVPAVPSNAPLAFKAAAVIAAVAAAIQLGAERGEAASGMDGDFREGGGVGSSRPASGTAGDGDGDASAVDVSPPLALGRGADAGHEVALVGLG